MTQFHRERLDELRLAQHIAGEHAVESLDKTGAGLEPHAFGTLRRIRKLQGVLVRTHLSRLRLRSRRLILACAMRPAEERHCPS